MISLATVIARLCERAKMTSSQYDVTELEGIEIEGFSIGRVTNALDPIKILRLCGLFDIIERNRTLYFKVRGSAAVATLTDADLGARPSGDSFIPGVSTRKIQEFELPRQIRLKYISKERDYEPSEQLSPSRLGTPGTNDVDVDCPVVLTDNHAAQTAEITFREAWTSRHIHEFAVDQSFLALEPADVLLVPIDGRLFRVRIVYIDDRRLTIRSIYAVRDDDGAYVSTALASIPRRQAPVVTLTGDTEAAFLDLPALIDTHDEAGFYTAAHRASSSQSWVGATVYRSVDGGVTHQVVASLANEVVFGTVVSGPTSGNVYTWDDSGQYVIQVENGSLESRTDAALDAGANCAAIGEHGRWHLFQFGTATPIGGGQYRLTHLLLGRRGTEHNLPLMEIGDRFVLVSGAGIYRTLLQNSEIGAARLYRPITNGQSFDAVADVSFTGAGQALECFSPVAVYGERDGSDNLTINWTRRDRLSKTLTDGVAVPNSEDSEDYEVDILDAGVVVRTISSLSSPTASYSAADQTTDFGSPQAAIDIRVYQLSATVGRGTPAEVTV